MFRRFAAALASVALMGHSLAMLLAVALTPTANASPLPAFMEICTPEGIVYLPFDQPLNQDAPQGPERHHSGKSLDGCPVCTAFGQLSGATPPAAATPVALGGGVEPLLWHQATAQQHQTARLPQSRAPPRRA
ncbi:DUF2946 family protein [Pelagibius sp.]|uniref:DUF2946 family protein n=1 Tax=Pelagibius sp. TaxID=1931238 RepID=UPI003BAEFFB6